MTEPVHHEPITLEEIEQARVRIEGVAVRTPLVRLAIEVPDTEIHLHWELRTGDTFLGQGLPPDEVRALYEGLFEPVPGNASFQ